MPGRLIQNINECIIYALAFRTNIYYDVYFFKSTIYSPDDSQSSDEFFRLNSSQIIGISEKNKIN